MNAPVQRGRSVAQKSLAILLYSMFGASFRGIGRFLKVSDVAVYKWIKKHAESLEKPKIPMPSETITVVLDEMWHFVNGKPNKVWIWKAYDPVKKQTFAWKIGKRDNATLKEFLEEIGMDERNFVTDDYEAYHQLIPEAQLRTGKDLTYPIEQDNSNTRHYIGRFRRRSKTTSRCIKMVELSLLLLFHFQHGNLMETMQSNILQLLS
jgi:insertion element IS1 protein InsB